jgi:F-type H+-transporting ATPase subunit b
MFLKIDGTFWIQIINFFIFFAILNVVYVKPAAAALRKRREYIDSVQAEYEAAQRQARELLAAADERALEAHRVASRGAAEILSDAQREADRIALRAQEEATGIVERARAEVEKELSAARAQEEALVQDLAQMMLGRALAPTERRAR